MTDRHCEFCHIPMPDADCCDSEFESKGCPHMAPGHTDLMVTPESIDKFLEDNPLPDEPEVTPSCGCIFCDIGFKAENGVHHFPAYKNNPPVDAECPLSSPHPKADQR